VLVVDDDRGLQETLQALLELEGYDVVVAGDGVEALEKLDSLRPDAILLDLMMPRMNGFEFVSELQRQGRRSVAPIIVLTADGGARSRAAQIGVDGYIAKPFDVTDLLDTLDQVVTH
jgi:two-component system response regulator MprA